METTIQSASSKKRKTILIGLGVAVTGILGYIGWQYWKKKKQMQMDFATESSTPVQDSLPARSPVKSTPKTNDNFPLKKGSKGPNVKALQQALIAKYGVSILPKFGVDGDFGNEVVEALKKAGLPQSVDQATLQSIATPSVQVPAAPIIPALNASQIAKDLYQAAIKKDLKQVLVLLKQLSSTAQYSQVSTAFQTYRIGGVRQTLVNGLLNSFTVTAQKEQIRAEFVRMGLKYDGSKWSLSGLDGSAMLITTAPTVIWKDKDTPIQVGQHVVLGKEVLRRNDHVVFENNGHNFLVNSTSVTYFPGQ